MIFVSRKERRRRELLRRACDDKAVYQKLYEEQLKINQELEQKLAVMRENLEAAHVQMNKAMAQADTARDILRRADAARRANAR